MLPADEEVANTVQCHPHLPVLATSGIEDIVRLWAPDGPRDIVGVDDARIAQNQQRMREGAHLPPRILQVSLCLLGGALALGIWTPI